MSFSCCKIWDTVACGCVDAGNVFWVNYTGRKQIMSLPLCSNVTQDKEDGVYLCFYVRVCVFTSGKSWPGPGCLHLLPCVGQHVVPLGFIDQITTRLRWFDQLLVIHHVQQVGRVDEGKTHHCQQVWQMLRRQMERRQRKEAISGKEAKIKQTLIKPCLQTSRLI